MGKKAAQIPFTAVGMRYRGGHRFTEEDVITLQPEPLNKHDANAIKILANGEHVAYVSREDTQTVAPYISTRGQVTIDTAFANSVLMNITVPHP